MENIKIYEIANDLISIKISEMGAELKSLRDKNDIEYIWCGNKKYWNRSTPFLFPIVGTLKDKKTIINGKTYDIMQHGLLRDQCFEVLKQTNNTISFVNTYNEKTLKIYPFKYKAIVTYQLKDKCLNTEVSIINEGEEIMPFNIGGHPGFNCPLYPNEKFTDYSICFEEKETFYSPLVMENATLNFNERACEYKNLKVLNLNKELFTIDTIIIPRVKSKTVSLLNKEGKGVIFSYPKFSTLAIWSPYNDAPFVCLEPWIGYNDRFDTDGDFLKKDNIVSLEPLDKFVVGYSITLTD